MFFLERKSWILAVVVFAAGCGAQAPPEVDVVRPARIMLVGDSTAIRGRVFPGRALATQEVNLSFRVSGPLITLPINIGDELEAGALLARIDPRDYETRLRNTEGQLARAVANQERAASELRRVVSIQQEDAGAISEARIDRAREQLALAKADISALEASVDAAKDELADTYLTAPFDGVIVATSVENHEYVQARQPITRLLDQSKVEFVVNIPETLISLARDVANILVTFDAFPGVTIPAQIKEIGTEASQTTRTFPVTLIMDQPEGATILPGMAGSATGQVGGEESQLEAPIVVPAHSIFSPSEGRASYVWVVEASDNTVHQRQVELGQLSGVGVTISSGLERGEQIATAGVHFLKEGQQIRPLTD